MINTYLQLEIISCYYYYSLYFLINTKIIKISLTRLHMYKSIRLIKSNNSRIINSASTITCRSKLLDGRTAKRASLWKQNNPYIRYEERLLLVDIRKPQAMMSWTRDGDHRRPWTSSKKEWHPFIVLFNEVCYLLL